MKWKKKHVEGTMTGRILLAAGLLEWDSTVYERKIRGSNERRKRRKKKTVRKENKWLGVVADNWMGGQGRPFPIHTPGPRTQAPPHLNPSTTTQKLSQMFIFPLFNSIIMERWTKGPMDGKNNSFHVSATKKKKEKKERKKKRKKERKKEKESKKG